MVESLYSQLYDLHINISNVRILDKSPSTDYIPVYVTINWEALIPLISKGCSNTVTCLERSFLYAAPHEWNSLVGAWEMPERLNSVLSRKLSKQFFLFNVIIVWINVTIVCCYVSMSL